MAIVTYVASMVPRRITTRNRARHTQGGTVDGHAGFNGAASDHDAESWQSGAESTAASRLQWCRVGSRRGINLGANPVQERRFAGCFNGAASDHDAESTGRTWIQNWWTWRFNGAASDH